MNARTWQNTMKLAVVAGAVLVPALCAAQTSPADEEHHGPRPEAIAACKDKSAGDTCEFDGPRGHVMGTCRTTKSGDLACWHPHHHHDHGSDAGGGSS